MNRSEIEDIRSRMAEKLATLRDSLRNRDQITIETVPDHFDQVQLRGERDLAILNLDRDNKMVQQIRRAQSRIEDGTYGTCIHCEEPISVKRLAAVPWATLCIDCQNEADRHHIDIQEPADISVEA